MLPLSVWVETVLWNSRPPRKLIVGLMGLGVAIGLVMLMFLAVPVVGGQEELSIDKMEIMVWPEYDDPRVLVQYQGEFTKAKFPQKVQFLVPQGAAINSACAIRPGGQHTNEPWESKDVSDGLTLITYNLAEPTFHMEFYWNALQGNPDKTLSYSYKATYPIKALSLEIQQPLKASNFTLNPASTRVSSDKDGFSYYHYSYDNLAKDQAVSVAVSYNKADPAPSISGSPGKAGATSLSPSSTLTVIIVIAAAFLLGGGAFWFMNRRSRSQWAPVRAKASAQAVTRDRQAGNLAEGKQRSAETRFCTNCGSSLSPNDNFCPRCGQKIRRKQSKPFKADGTG